MEMVKEAIAFYTRCAVKADLDVKVLFDITTLTVPAKFTGALEVFENVEMDEGVVTIVSGDCFLLSDEIAEHAPNASFEYDAKLWKFTASEFAALYAVIKEFGLKVEFVPADDEDDEAAGSNEEDGE